MKRISFVKRRKAARPDGISIPFFKNGGEIVKPELTNLLESSWTREEIL